MNKYDTYMKICGVQLINYNLSSQFSFLHNGLFPCTPYKYYSIYFGFTIYLTLYPKLQFHFQDHICCCGSQRELECATNPVFLCVWATDKEQLCVAIGVKNMGICNYRSLYPS
jgi:hypothetical protein